MLFVEYPIIPSHTGNGNVHRDEIHNNPCISLLLEIKSLQTCPFSLVVSPVEIMA